MISYEEAVNWLKRCVRCGTCKYVFGTYEPSCPAGEFFGFESFFSSGKLWMGGGLAEGRLDWKEEGLLEALYACTTCANCQTQCQLAHADHIVEVFEALRAEAFKQGAAPLAAHKAIIESIRNHKNPWGQPARRRDRWARNLDVPRSGGRILYYVGCTAALDPQIQVVARDTVRIFTKLGLDFMILGNDEVCCGSVAIRVGERDLARSLAEHNIRTFNNLGVETIVTSCAGCYKTLTQDYPYFGHIEPEVLHTSQFLDRLLKSGKLRMTGTVPLRVTYHDPCHMGRHTRVFDAPRSVLKAVPGIRFREMDRIRENAWCCGAGGGVRSGFPELASQTSLKRVTEAEATGAEAVVSTCPFCFQNVAAGLSRAGSSLRMLDLTALVRAGVENGTP